MVGEGRREGKWKQRCPGVNDKGTCTPRRKVSVLQGAAISLFPLYIFREGHHPSLELPSQWGQVYFSSNFSVKNQILVKTALLRCAICISDSTCPNLITSFPPRTSPHLGFAMPGKESWSTKATGLNLRPLSKPLLPHPPHTTTKLYSFCSFRPTTSTCALCLVTMSPSWSQYSALLATNVTTS